MATAEPRSSQHPLAGKTMVGADVIIQVLADEGVDTIFGYSGGAILPTYDAIFQFNGDRPEDKQIRLVVPANEQGAGFMAAGYSRASGKVGVALVTSGPGATNAVTPIRDCMADSVPIVLICGQVPRPAIGTDAFQEAPIFNIMSSCAKHVFLVDDETKLEATIRTAFEIARSGRPGPVVIDIPKDVQQSTGTFKGEGMLDFRGFMKRKTARAETVLSKEKGEEFFRILRQSERPLIYAGGGIISQDIKNPEKNTADELRRFAERYQIPVVTTLMGIGAMDTSSELCLHMLGMHGMAYANYAVQDCDFLIAIGARFDDRVAGVAEAFAPNAKNIAHIDIDAAEIGKVKAVTWSHTAPAINGLRELMAIGCDFKKNFQPWLDHVKELRETHRLNFNRETELIQPQEVIEILSGITKGEAIISTGVGQHQMWAAQYFDFKNPRSWLTSGSMGTMGFGLPAAIGAQFAFPDRLVIDVDGDGSLRMNMGELETCTTYDVPVKILLLNNLGDGMVRQWQTLMYDERYSGTDKSLHKKNFVKAAEADDFEFAKRVSKREELPAILKEFVEFEGPAFLEVMIDMYAQVWPMVGPGKSYAEMEVGPWITPRQSDAGEGSTDIGNTSMF